MRAKGYDRWGYPVYMTETEERLYPIWHDWDRYDRSTVDRDLHHQEQFEAWLHQYDEIDCSYCLVDMSYLQETPYTPKPSRNIRAEKTRDYRKRRPKAQRYNPEIVPTLALFSCLIGVSS